MTSLQTSGLFTNQWSVYKPVTHLQTSSLFTNQWPFYKQVKFEIGSQHAFVGVSTQSVTLHEGKLATAIVLTLACT